MPHLTLDDGDQLWFEHHGSGPPLLLVTGLGGRADFWDAHVERLSKHYLVVTHDHRGTGASSRRRMQFSIDQMAADVLALADHLDIESFHVCGHSTGGAIAQTLALDHSTRVRCLILSATWAGKDSYIDSLFSLRRDVLEQMGLSAYRRMANLMLKPPRSFVSQLPELASIGIDAPAVGDDAHNISNRIRALLDFDRVDQLAAINNRTFISCARDDVIIPPHCSEVLHRCITGSTLKVYASGGHAYTNVLVDEFNADLLSFLTRSD